jgi:type VI secretion system protein VasI
MSHIKNALRILLAIFIGFIGLGQLVIGASLSAVLLFIAAVVVLPIQKLSGGVTTLIVLGLCFGAIFFWMPAEPETRVKTPAPAIAPVTVTPTQKQIIADIVAENKRYFESNREQVIADLQQAFASGQYQEVRLTGGRYQAFDDTIKRMVMEADVEIQNNPLDKLRKLRLLANTYPDDPSYQARIADFEQQQQAQHAKAEEQREINQAMKRWNFSSENSDIDDSLSIYLSVKADKPFRGTLNKPTYASLHLRCAENTTSFYIHWDIFLSTNDMNMMYRIDQQSAVTKRFDVSSSHEGLGYFSGSKSIPLIKSMLGHNTFLAKVTPYGHDSVSATFDITGLDKAIGALRRVCKW